MGSNNGPLGSLLFGFLILVVVACSGTGKDEATSGGDGDGDSVGSGGLGQGSPGDGDSSLGQPCDGVCGVGLTCHEGVCVCEGGLPACGGACVNTQTDPLNCGMCGVACEGGATCTLGSCQTPGEALFVSFEAPMDGASVSGDLSPVSVNVTGGPESVELFLEEHSVGVDAIAPYEWSSDAFSTLGGLAPGAYTLRAVATKGAESAEAEVQVSVVLEGASLVEIEVSSADERVVLWVNGVPRRSFRWNGPGQNERQDISGWFGAGENTVRIQQFNQNGGSGLGVRLWVDGQLKKEIDQFTENGGESIEFDEVFTVDVPSLPALRQVTLEGPAGSPIYMNHTFTGLTTPTTMQLPQGELLVGLGVGDFIGENRYEGAYHEQTIDIVGPATIDLSTGEQPPPNVWKVALLPVRTTHHGEGSSENTGVLLDADVDKMETQLAATSEFGIEPLSFGLMTWDVTRLPVTDTVLFRPADSGIWPDTDQLLIDAGLTSLKDEYDLIVTVYSEHRANGQPVNNRPCCGWGGGKGIAIPTGWVRSAPADEPNEGYIHEALHSYESYQGWLLYRLPVTIGGLHGGGAQGYQSGACGEQHWMCWYKDFIRGRVGISLDMNGDDYPAPPASPNAWGGVFYTMRMGTGGKVHGPLSID